MKRVHLYWVKVFGCHIAEETIPIDLTRFSHALLTGTCHPFVYIRFGCFQIGQPIAGMSNIETAQLSDGSCAFATWLYHIEPIGVNVMFAIPGEQRKGLVNAWHPREGAKRLVLHEFG